MWLLLILSLIAPAEISNAPAGVSPKSYLVHGYLDAFWEYPNFLPDDLPHRQGLPFQFQEKAWAEAYAAPVREALRDGADTSVCFRIFAMGYVAARKPTTMWPANEQFIFTRVITLEPMTSTAECEARMRRKDG